MEEEVENLVLHYEEFGEEMPPLLFDEKMLLDQGQQAFKMPICRWPVGFAYHMNLELRKLKELS